MSEVQSTRISGTKEWSVASVNCVTGCEHNCRYCYARARAVCFGQIKTPKEWRTMRVRPGDVKKRRRLEAGRVMFPTTHDITPSTLGPCMDVIGNLLDAGNEVLIVSKPHWACIRDICHRFFAQREQILFRFSIGAFDDAILKTWEPGAPSFAQRLASLKHAHDQGFVTSVSCEPLLDQPRVVELIDRLAPFITDTIWIGCMNRIGERVGRDVGAAEVARIRAGQTSYAIRQVYAGLSDRPYIRWKESYKEVLGLELAEAAGLDT